MYRKKVGSDKSHTKGFVFLSLFNECICVCVYIICVAGAFGGQ